MTTMNKRISRFKIIYMKYVLDNWDDFHNP